MFLKDGPLRENNLPGNIRISKESWVLRMACYLNQTELWWQDNWELKCWMKFMELTWDTARAFSLQGIMTAQIKGKVSSCAVCSAFRNRQQREVPSSWHSRITLASSWDWPVWIWWPNVPVSYWLLFEVLWNRTASPDHRHLCHQQLEENICEVWNPRESCQWQRTAVQQHQKFVQRQPLQQRTKTHLRDC